MSTELDVSWEEVEKATEAYKDYYCGWRRKVEKGEDPGSLAGVYREVLFEVNAEAKMRRGFSWAEFPYYGPKRGELPGFFKKKETVESERLKDSHPAIHRESCYVEVYGYWSEMAAIAHEMAMEQGKQGLPDIPDDADQEGVTRAEEKREYEEGRLAVLMGLARVLGQVAIDCMRQRKRFFKMVGNEGIAAASWMMDYVVAAGEVGESDAFSMVEKKMRDKLLEERLKVRSKMEAHKREGAKNGSVGGDALNGGASSTGRE